MTSEDLKKFTDNRTKELIRSFNVEPNSKNFIDLMIHSKYNYPTKHDELLKFLKNNFDINEDLDFAWRTHRVLADMEIQIAAVGFIEAQHVGNN